MVAYLTLGVDGVVESDDVFMVHFFEKFYFFNDASFSLIVRQLILIVDLNCHVKRCSAVLCFFDYRICTLA
jgi:hypothetical protein